MDDSQLYSTLRTSIIGGAYEACGVGYDPEEDMDVYHLDEFSENVDPDDIKGAYHSPDSFLEELCGTFAGRIYEAMYIMESSWKLGKSTSHKDWQTEICRKLWSFGKEDAINYLSQYGEEDELVYFVDKGDKLFT